MVVEMERLDPIFIYRQHQSAISALAFSPCMEFFASGDIEGNVKLYSLETDRPIISWSPHSAGILSIEFIRIRASDSDRLYASECPDDPLVLITHGRDMNIHFWQLDLLEGASDPKILYSLPVNSLNFCKLSLLIGRGL
jgi:WD40 repeat protein